jgi:hypothetical protein
LLCHGHGQGDEPSGASGIAAAEVPRHGCGDLRRRSVPAGDDHQDLDGAAAHRDVPARGTTATGQVARCSTACVVDPNARRWR